MADRFDEGFEITPPGLEALDADEQLALEDEIEEAPFAGVEVGPQEPPPLGRTPAYDFIARTFRPARSGGPLLISGRATLAQWVEKCLLTRRGESPAVDPSFGVNIHPYDILDGGVFEEAAFAEATADWTRAILVHPHVSAVEDWDIQSVEDGTAAAVFVRVIPEGLVEQDITVALEIGGGSGG
jgi:hypothetical protein